MKFISAAMMAVLLTGLAGNVSAGDKDNVEAKVSEHDQMSLPLVQKVANHMYKSKRFVDGTNMTSVYWTGKKVFQNGESCLIVEQNFSHFNKGESPDKTITKEPVVKRTLVVKDCDGVVAFI